jgi:DNA-binding NarL/FixJ family response regulator
MQLFNELTKREEEVLHLLARDYTNKEIADKLCISVYTVQNHLKRVFRAIGVSNRAGATRVYWSKQHKKLGGGE